MSIRATINAVRTMPAYASAPFLRRWSGVPVFFFHSPPAAEVEADLRFLADNGYRTMGAEETAAMCRQRRPDPKAVALCFDDGRASSYAISFPLVKKYGQTGIFFVTTRWPREDVRRPSLEDVWAGRCSEEEMLRQMMVHPLMCWREMRELAASGHADLQPESHSHLWASASQRLVDFQRPGPYGHPLYPDPPRCWGERQEVRWGAPIFEPAWEPAIQRPFVPSREMEDECVRLAEAEGGPAFFQAPGWRRRLNQIVDRWRKQGGTGAWGQMRDRDSLLRRTTEEIALCRQILEERLGGRRAHFSTPMHSTTPLVVEAARTAGMESIFDGQVRSRPGESPVIVPRSQPHWLPFLPGRGRRSFWKACLAHLSPGRSRRCRAD